MRGGVGVAASIVAVACTGGDPCEGGTGISPTLELGEGAASFERALAETGSLTAEYGPQGGHHVWLAVRTTGFAPGFEGSALSRDRETPIFIAELYDDTSLLTMSSTQQNAMDGDITQAELALRRLVTSDLPYDDLDGTVPYRLRVVGTDVCGTTVEAEQSIVISFYDYGY